MTFLVTDIEDSTAMWDSDSDAMELALARHDELIEQAVTAAGGVLIKSKGEGSTFTFTLPLASAAASLSN